MNKTSKIPTVEILRKAVCEEKKTDTALAAEYGVCPVTVMHWRQKYGLANPYSHRQARASTAPPNPRRKVFLTKAELHKLYVEQGLSQKQIAKMHGVIQMTISNWLRHYSIKARPLGGRISVHLPEEKLRDLYIVKKWTMEKVAKEFGCGESTVRQNLIRFGLQIDRTECHHRRLTTNRERYAWKTEAGGYIRIRKPDHPAATSDGYVQEHRLVAEKALGRSLRPGEKVHHINLNKRENAVSNLAVLPGVSAHSRVHHYMGRVAAYLCGLTTVRPEALDFCCEVFWGGRYLKTIDLIEEARSRSVTGIAGSVEIESPEERELPVTIN